MVGSPDMATLTPFPFRFVRRAPGRIVGMLSHHSGIVGVVGIGIHNMLWLAVATIHFPPAMGTSPPARNRIQWCPALVTFHGFGFG